MTLIANQSLVTSHSFDHKVLYRKVDICLLNVYSKSFTAKNGNLILDMSQIAHEIHVAHNGADETKSDCAGQRHIHPIALFPLHNRESARKIT